MGAPRGERERGIFSETVDYVLKHAPCRVMVVAAGRRPHDLFSRGDAAAT
jgi:hypothetical protein